MLVFLIYFCLANYQATQNLEVSELHYMLVFCFSTEPRQNQKEGHGYFVDYQLSSGSTVFTSHFGLDLIRSISVNHRVAMSTMTCSPWFCKTSLQPPVLSPLHTNPIIQLFSLFPPTMMLIYPPL